MPTYYIQIPMGNMALAKQLLEISGAEVMDGWVMGSATWEWVFESDKDLTKLRELIEPGLIKSKLGKLDPEDYSEDDDSYEDLSVLSEPDNGEDED